MTPARALLVEDEPLARRRLLSLLEELPELVTVVGEATGCADALSAIMRLQPDLLFVDIELSDGIAFDLLHELSSLPPVIFVTAFDAYAVRAFDAGALDYVLKPVRRDRLRLAVLRALNADRVTLDLRLEHLSGLVSQLKNQASATEDGEQEFWVRRANGDLLRVLSKSIEWASVEDYYVRLHVGADSYLIRDSIRGMSKRLGPSFMQVHRGTLVRISSVVKVAPDGHGLLDVFLSSGSVVKAGRVYAKEMRRMFRGAGSAP